MQTIATPLHEIVRSGSDEIKIETTDYNDESLYKKFTGHYTVMINTPLGMVKLHTKELEYNTEITSFESYSGDIFSIPKTSQLTFSFGGEHDRGDLITDLINSTKTFEIDLQCFTMNGDLLCRDRYQNCWVRQVDFIDLDFSSNDMVITATFELG